MKVTSSRQPLPPLSIETTRDHRAQRKRIHEVAPDKPIATGDDRLFAFNSHDIHLDFSLDQCQSRELEHSKRTSPFPGTRSDRVRFDPATREKLGEIAVDEPDDVRRAVAAAAHAQIAWRTSTFKQRRAVLRHMLDHLVDNADELCDVIARDAGKTRENAMLSEIWPVAEKLRWTIANGAKHLRPERVSSGLFVHKRAEIEFTPLGVVGIIAPWNYPLQNILGPAIPALFAGNGVVVKVSEAVAWSAPRFKRIFDEALTAAGFSPDLVQIVQGVVTAKPAPRWCRAVCSSSSSRARRATVAR